MHGEVNTLDALSAMLNIMVPFVAIPFGLIVVMTIAKVIIELSPDGSVVEAKPIRLKPSEAIKNIVSSIDGVEEPDWLEKLIRYEKQEIADKKVKNAIEKMEKAFNKEYEQLLENLDAFKKLANHTDGVLSDIAERSEEQPVMSNLTAGLSKQKELVLNLALEILEMRIQENTATRVKEANELAKKMEKELVGNRETVVARNHARSVHEEVLHEILASKEATEDMKKRAEAMLPHFTSMSPEEEQSEVKRQDFELDLRTMEGILRGNGKIPDHESA